MIKHCVQNYNNECGIACLKMFYDLYDVNKEYNDILKEVKIEEKGVSISEMLNSLNNLTCFKAYELEKEKLKEMCPLIVIVKKRKRNHYIVVWKYEDGKFYISDPSKSNIVTIKEKSLLDIFTGLIIFSQKREVVIPRTYNMKIKSGPYKIPYLILSLLEVFLLTFSMLYLFSIKDFTFIKIFTFLIIIVINFIISLLKNLCFNYIQKNIDDKSLFYVFNDKLYNGNINSIEDIKKKLKIGYQIKHNYIHLLTNIMPSIFIVVGSLIYLFFINIIIFISIFILYLILFAINLYFERLKKKVEINMYYYENKIDLYDSKVLDINNKKEVVSLIDKMKDESSKLLVINQTNTLINFVIRQFSLMLILISMYIFHKDIYAIFVITFYFYSFDGIISICRYLSNMKEIKYLRNIFINE